MKIEDKILLDEIRKRNSKVFEMLFSDYYASLIRYADGFVFDKSVSDDIVQNFFIYLWEDGEHLEIKSSLRAYFFQLFSRTLKLCFHGIRGNFFNTGNFFGLRSFQIFQLEDFPHFFRK